MANTVTIVFRGLMVFHDDVTNKRMEFGILPADGHFPRILTIKNGVLFSVTPLKQEIEDRGRIWELQPAGPIGDGPARRQSGPDPINRPTHGAESDFRLVVDFENNEFPFGDLTERLDTSKLKPLVFVPTGEFYTRLKSPDLNRLNKSTGESESFGPLAAVIGLDIPLTGDFVDLVDKTTGDSIFQFTVEPNTIYEFCNAPSDTGEKIQLGPEHRKGHEAGHAVSHAGGHAAGPVLDAAANDHFLHYYDLFKDLTGVPQFFFEEAGLLGAPGPNPFLCGVLFLGQRSTPLD